MENQDLPYPLSFSSSESDETTSDRSLGEWGKSKRARALYAQMVGRPPIPEDTWGDDLGRCAAARTICEIIRDAFVWPNDRFIPADPFRCVFFNVDTDGCLVNAMEDKIAVTNLSKYLGFDVHDDIVAALETESTLGEVINNLLDKCET